MVRITEQLIRKKSEHNELIISTLEELSLHQEDIERIEHIHDWCRELKILLMPNNLIGKLENLWKFKRLEYLNLAINNIEKIENLEKLESLVKLDLTLNFVGDLTSSIESLSANENLRELILTGNPCTDFVGYREFVLATLPHLSLLDAIEVKRPDVLLAKRNYVENRRSIVQQEAEYSIRRDEQKLRVKEQQKREQEENEGLSDEEINKRFWKKKSEHCPETRVEISNQHIKNKKRSDEPKRKQRRTPKLFAECGRAYCVNQAKLKFDLCDERDRYELNLHTYKFMDTSLMNVNVQPTYVRVTIKGKIFQMLLNNEVKIAESTTQRSMITGHLLIVMPKVNFTEALKSTVSNNNPKKQSKSKLQSSAAVNYHNICNGNSEIKKEPLPSTELIDETDVPPLI